MKPTTRDGILRGGYATIIRLLILAAAGISGYLLSVSLSGGQVAGCGPGLSCDEVLQSRWAYVLGVPVSALALVVDLAALLTSFSCGSKSTPKQRRGAWEILVPGGVLLAGAALWFTALQAFVLHRFCPWCLAAHGCGAVAAVLLLLRVPLTDAVERRDKSPALARGTAVRNAAFAVFALALLGAAQTFAPGKTYSVSVVPAGLDLPSANVGHTTSLAEIVNYSLVPAGTSTSANATVIGTTGPPRTPIITTQVTLPLPTPAPADARTLALFGGRLRLDLTQVPIWGSPDAPHKLVSLYDYTCHHCREMHERVVEVQRSFGGKLAVVSLPMPLDSECNALIRRTHPMQTNACTYARMGLAVWRAKREAIQPFDDWFFGFPTPPLLAEATNKAMQLVGAEAFARASRDPWITAQLSTNIELFTISSRDYRNGSMPQFMIGTNVVTGTLTSEQLRAVIARYVDAPSTAR